VVKFGDGNERKMKFGELNKFVTFFWAKSLRLFFISVLFATAIIITNSCSSKKVPGDGTMGTLLLKVSGDDPMQYASLGSLFAKPLEVSFYSDSAGGKVPMEGVQVSFRAEPYPDSFNINRSVADVRILPEETHTDKYGRASALVMAGATLFPDQKFYVVASIPSFSQSVKFVMQITSSMDVSEGEPFAFSLETDKFFDVSTDQSVTGHEWYGKIPDSVSGSLLPIDDDEYVINPVCESDESCAADLNLCSEQCPALYSKRFKRNFITAGEALRFKIVVTDYKGAPVSTFPDATVVVDWQNDAGISWTGKTSSLPGAGYSQLCQFINGVCWVGGTTIATATPFTANGFGKIRVVASAPATGLKSGAADLFVQRGNVSGVVIQNGEGGPSYTFTTMTLPDGSEEQVRTNVGTEPVYEGYHFLASNAATTLSAALVDAGGNYVRDSSTVESWTFTADVFTNASATNLFHDEVLVNAAVQGDTNEQLFFTPKTKGDGFLFVQDDAFTYGASVIVQNNLPYKFITSAGDIAGHENTVRAGVISPIRVILADRYGNVCEDVIDDTVDVSVDVNYYNMTTSQTATDFVSPVVPNSSGGLSISAYTENAGTFGTFAAFPIVQANSVVMGYYVCSDYSYSSPLAYNYGDPNLCATAATTLPAWPNSAGQLVTAAGGTLIPLRFIYGTSYGAENAGLRMAFKDIHYRPYISIVSNESSFMGGLIPSGKSGAITTDAVASGAPRITVWRGEAEYINLRSNQGGTWMPVCKNGFWRRSLAGTVQNFTRDGCSGVLSSNPDPNYKCDALADNTLNFCTSYTASNEAYTYAAFFEDKWGNVVDANYAAGGDYDPIDFTTSLVTGSGLGSLKTAGLVTFPAGNVAVIPGSVSFGAIGLSTVGNYTFEYDEGGTYAKSLSSYNVIKIVSDKAYKYEIAMDSLVSTATATLIVRAFDKLDNWIDAKGDPWTARLYLVDTSASPAPNAASNVRVNGVDVDGSIVTGATACAGSPFPVDGDSDEDYDNLPCTPTAFATASGLSPVPHTIGAETRDVYKIPVVFPRAQEELKLAASGSANWLNGSVKEAYSEVITFTMAAGPLASANLRNEQDVAPSFTYVSGGSYTFTADDNEEPFCVAPIDAFGNYSDITLDNGSVSFDQTSVWSIFKNNRASNSSYEKGCIEVNFITSGLGTLSDSTLLGTWSYGMTSKSASINISILPGVIDHAALDITADATYVAGSNIGLNILKIYDYDNNLLSENAGGTTLNDADNGPKNVTFNLTDSSYLAFTGPENHAPANGVYTFAAGAVVGPTAEANQFKVSTIRPDQKAIISATVMGTSAALATVSKRITLVPSTPNHIDIACLSATGSTGTAGVNFDCDVAVHDLGHNIISTATGASGTVTITLDPEPNLTTANNATFVSSSFFTSTTITSATRFVGTLSAGTGRVTIKMNESKAPSVGFGNLKIKTLSTDAALTTTIASTAFGSADVKIFPRVADHLQFASTPSPTGPYDTVTAWNGPILNIYDNLNNIVWTDSTTLATGSMQGKPEANFAGGPLPTASFSSGSASFAGTRYSVPGSSLTFMATTSTMTAATGPITVNSAASIKYAVIALDGQTTHFPAADIDSVITGVPNSTGTYTAGSTIGARVYFLDDGLSIVGTGVTDDPIETANFRFDMDDAAANAIELATTRSTTSDNDGSGATLTFASLNARTASATGVKYAIRIYHPICDEPNGTGPVICLPSTQYEVKTNPSTTMLAVGLSGQTLHSGFTAHNDAFPDIPFGGTKVAGSSFTVFAHVTDAYHNVLPTVATASISMPGRAANSFSFVSTTATLTNGTGAFVAYDFRASTVPSGTIVVNVPATPSWGSGTATIYSIAAGTAARVIAIMSSQAATFGDRNESVANVLGVVPDGSACSSLPVKFKVVDRYFNPVTATTASGVLSFNTTDTNDIAKADIQSITFTSGSASINMSTYSRGTWTLSTVGTVAGASFTAASGTYRAPILLASASKAIVELPGQTHTDGSWPLATATTQTAGVNFNVKVIATDNCYNRITTTTSSATVTTLNTSSNATYNLGAMSSGTVGGAIALHKAMSSQYVTPVVTGLTSVPSSMFTVASNTAVKNIVLTLPGQTLITGVATTAEALANSPQDQRAGTAFTVKAFLVDNYFNIETTGTDAVGVSLGAANMAGVVNGIFSDTNALLGGQFTFNSAAAGSLSFNVTNRLSTSVSGSSLRFVPQGGSAGITTHFTSSAYEVDPGNAAYSILYFPSAETHREGYTTWSGGARLINSAYTMTAGSAVNFMAKLVDANFNTVTSDNRGFTLNTSSQTTSDILSFSSGTYLGSYTEYKRTHTGALHYLSITNSGVGTNYQSSSFVARTNPSATKLLALLPGQSLKEGKLSSASAVSGAPSTQTVGSIFDVRVVAVDQYFNHINTTSAITGVTFSFIGDTYATAPTATNIWGSCTLDTGYTSDAGGCITLGSAFNKHAGLGKALVPVNTAGIVSFTSSSYVVNEGSGKRIVYGFSDQTLVEGISTLTFLPSMATATKNAGVDFGVRLYAVDDYHNITTDSSTSVWSIKNSVDSLTAPVGSYTFSSGVINFAARDSAVGDSKTFTFTNSGSYTHTALANRVEYDVTTGSSNISFLVAVANQISTYNYGVDTAAEALGSIAVGTQTAGSSFAVLIRAVDSNFNTISNFSPPTSLAFQFINTTPSPNGDIARVHGVMSSPTFTNGTYLFTAALGSFVLYNSSNTNVKLKVVSEGPDIIGYSPYPIPVTANSSAAVLKIVDAPNGSEIDTLAYPTNATSADPTFWAAKYDSFGNFIGNDTTADWTFTRTDGTLITTPFSAIPMASVTNASSVVLNLIQSGEMVVTATSQAVGSPPADSSGIISISAGNADHFDLALSTAGDITSASAFNIIITAMTSSDTTAVSYTGVRSIVFSPSSNADGSSECSGINLISNVTGTKAITFAGGSGTFTSGTLYRPDTYTISAVDRDNVLIGGTTTAHVVPGPVACTKIFTGSNGEGSLLNGTTVNLKIGQSTTMYAASYDAGGNFLGNNDSVSWVTAAGASIAAFTASGGTLEVSTTATGSIFNAITASSGTVGLKVSPGDLKYFMPLFPGESYSAGGVASRAAAISGVAAFTTGADTTVRFIAVDSRFYKTALAAGPRQFKLTWANFANSHTDPVLQNPVTTNVSGSFVLASGTTYLDKTFTFYTADGSSPILTTQVCGTDGLGSCVSALQAPLATTVDHSWIAPNTLSKIKVVLASDGSYGGDNLPTSGPSTTVWDKASTATSASFVAYGYDAYGNFISKMANAVWSTVDSTAIVIGPATATTGTFNLTASTAGRTHIVATHSGVAGTSPLLYLKKDGIAYYNIDVDTTPAVTAGVDTWVMVTAKDESGVTVATAPSTTLTFTIPSANTAGCGTLSSLETYGSVTAVPFSSGVYSFQAKFKVANSNRVMSTISPVVGDSATFTVSADSENNACYRVSSSASAAQNLGAAISLNLNVSGTYYVAAFDDYNNYYLPTESSSATEWMLEKGGGNYVRPENYNEVDLGTIITGFETGTFTLRIGTDASGTANVVVATGTTATGTFDYDDIDSAAISKAIFWDIPTTEAWATDDNLSWYDEYNSTVDPNENYRSARHDFPNKAMVLAYALNYVEIVDATANKKFMRINANTDAMPSGWGSINHMAAIAGKLFIGREGGLTVFDFANDQIHLVTSAYSSSSDNSFVDGKIAARNEAMDSWAAGSFGIIPGGSSEINYLATTRSNGTDYVAYAAGGAVVVINLETMAQASRIGLGVISTVVMATNGAVYFTTDVDNNLIKDSLTLNSVVASTYTGVNNTDVSVVDLKVADGLSSVGGALGQNIVYVAVEEKIIAVHESGTNPDDLTLATVALVLECRNNKNIKGFDLSKNSNAAAGLATTSDNYFCLYTNAQTISPSMGSSTSLGFTNNDVFIYRTDPSNAAMFDYGLGGIVDGQGKLILRRK